MEHNSRDNQEARTGGSSPHRTVIGDSAEQVGKFTSRHREQGISNEVEPFKEDAMCNKKVFLCGCEKVKGKCMESMLLVDGCEKENGPLGNIYDILVNMENIQDHGVKALDLVGRVLIPSDPLSIVPIRPSWLLVGSKIRKTKLIKEVGDDVNQRNSRIRKSLEDAPSKVWNMIKEMGIEGEEDDVVFEGIIRKMEARDRKKFKGKVDICFIQEPKILKVGDDLIMSIWGRDDFEWFAITARGRSRGIISIWRKDVITPKFSFRGDGYLGINCLWKGLNCYLVNIYSSCILLEKRNLWSNPLKVKSNFLVGEWLLGGDFNAIKINYSQILVNKFRFLMERLRWWNINVFGWMDLKIKEGVDLLNDIEDAMAYSSGAMSEEQLKSRREMIGVPLDEKIERLAKMQTVQQQAICALTQDMAGAKEAAQCQTS
ncbi:hypothetical protein KIW84_030283 [Lathyrus oleraceus]|uniref:Uncharacterized protein n=1 Tax=Pisum sativum TaxID=3888 RepID=A0A9D4XMG7_PEA|nr:hypothetical protein KIW84_030283 [Pisum sativum]